MTGLDELARRIRDFGLSFERRAPLYGRLAPDVADDPQLVALMLAAPVEQHNPTLLFCAVHDVVLRGEAPALAAFYPNLTAHPAGGDPFPTFRASVLEHAATIRETIATRHTQTNEIGRCALFLPALALVAADVGSLAVVDVGTSAGLNQLLARFHYRYQPGGDVGAASSVELVCGTRGAVPVPARIPDIATTVGLDSRPIDVHDDDAVRWLQACVPPDQADRFDLLAGAIAMARDHPPDVRHGDAVDDLAATVAGVADAGHPVVLNSWVLNYLSTDRQRAYVDVLDELGAQRDISWILAEAPAQTPGLPIPTTVEPEPRTVLSLVTWRGGRRDISRLATCHPHGYWLHWSG